MSEDELVERVRRLVADPRRRTSPGPGNHHLYAPSFAPAAAQDVADALQRFEFPIPSLLVRLWSEVANGGIGPGYGVYGVEGGMTDEAVDLPLPDLFLEWREDEYWGELIGPESAKRTFPICDWGCCTFSALDCSTPHGNILLFVDGVKRVDQNVSFAQWIEDWADGIDVGADDYSRVRRRSRWLGDPE